MSAKVKHFLHSGQAMGYPSDLTDAEWALIQPHFRPGDRRGSACLHPRKQIVDAILYVVKSGCQWRMLPNDFPNWKTVYHHFSRWNKSGVWEAAVDRVNAIHRRKSGRSASPSYGIVEHPSIFRRCGLPRDSREIR